jgi:hypothetical protein
MLNLAGPTSYRKGFEVKVCETHVPFSKNMNGADALFPARRGVTPTISSART